MSKNWGARTEYAQEVYLNVYDLAEVNSFIYHLGFGFFHSGVEINGREYT